MSSFSLAFTLFLRQNSPIAETILSFAINSCNSQLVALSSKKKLYHYCLTELFANELHQQVELELLVDSYHHDSVVAVDSCVRKPFIATCSIDRSLNIWNYDTESFELRKSYEEELFSVALHPSGLYLILGATNSLKYIAIHADKLETLHVFNVRSCSTCVFANGGHMFALVHGVVVQVFSSSNYSELSKYFDFF